MFLLFVSLMRSAREFTLLLFPSLFSTKNESSFELLHVSLFEMLDLLNPLRFRDGRFLLFDEETLL